MFTDEVEVQSVYGGQVCCCGLRAWPCLHKDNEWRWSMNADALSHTFQHVNTEKTRLWGVRVEKKPRNLKKECDDSWLKSVGDAWTPHPTYLHQNTSDPPQWKSRLQRAGSGFPSHTNSWTVCLVSVLQHSCCYRQPHQRQATQVKIWGGVPLCITTPTFLPCIT